MTRRPEERDGIIPGILAGRADYWPTAARVALGAAWARYGARALSRLRELGHSDAVASAAALRFAAAQLAHRAPGTRARLERELGEPLPPEPPRRPEDCLPPAAPGTDSPGTDSPGAAPGATPGTTPGADPGADPGAAPGADAAADPSADAAADAGADAGAEAAASAGADAAADPSADAAADAGAEAAASAGAGAEAAASAGADAAADAEAAAGAAAGAAADAERIAELARAVRDAAATAKYAAQIRRSARGVHRAAPLSRASAVLAAAREVVDLARGEPGYTPAPSGRLTRPQDYWRARGPFAARAIGDAPLERVTVALDCSGSTRDRNRHGYATTDAITLCGAAVLDAAEAAAVPVSLVRWHALAYPARRSALPRVTGDYWQTPLGREWTDGNNTYPDCLTDVVREGAALGLMLVVADGGGAIDRWRTLARASIAARARLAVLVVEHPGYYDDSRAAYRAVRDAGIPAAYCAQAPDAAPLAAALAGVIRAALGLEP